jgi:hypothetical protein
MQSIRAQVRRAAILCLVSAPLIAQNWISVGIKGGVPLTDSFADRSYQLSVPVVVRNPFGTVPFSPPSSLVVPIHTYSSSKNFVIGPTLEVRLPFGFSVESDALYRPLNLSVQQSSSGFGGFLLGTPSSLNSNDFDSWEFPILAKYRLPTPVIKPYLEAGPSFRVIASSAPQHLSTKGVSAGIGVEIKVLRFGLSPEFRYTHWGSDTGNANPYSASLHQNQVEFLVGLATMAGPNPAAHARPTRHLFSIGVKGGIPFTDSFVTDKITFVKTPSFSCGDFNSGLPCTIPIPTIQTYRASKTYLIGPMVEVHLPLGFSVEGDALYHPIDSLPPPATSGSHNNSWEFPIVGKYRFSTPFVRPYLEAGPTFRALSSTLDSYWSNTGITAGIGVEGKILKLHIAPEVRFVHWGNDSGNAYPFYASKRNQAQFLVGIAY